MVLLWMLLSWSGAADGQNTEASWSPLTRDIYVDGVLERSTYLLREKKGKRYILLREGQEEAWIIEGESDNLTWQSISAAVFVSSEDQLSYQTPVKLESKPGGSLTQIGKRQYFMQTDRHAIVIGPHEGGSGPMTAKQLFEIVPYWKRLHEAYQPAAQSVRALRAIQEETTLRVTLGTWCGDSRREVPRLMKALKLADNPRLKLELTALSKGFEEPWEAIVDGKVTNVPTVRALREDREIGKIVESPRIKAIEKELAYLLNGKLPDLSELEQEEVLAEGSFTHKDGSGEFSAHEHWRVVRRSYGGFRLFSQVRDGRLATDYRLEVNEEGRAVYLQVTETSDASHRRTRYSLGKERLRGTRRGHATGIVRQHLGFRHGLLLKTRSAVINGWCLARHKGSQASVLNLAEGMGSIQDEQLSDAGRVEWRGAVGNLTARKRGWQGETWMIHESLGLPLRHQSATGSAELDTLVLHSAAALEPTSKSNDDKS